MLVLSRVQCQGLEIGDLLVKVVQVRPGKVRIGFRHPSIRILRKELAGLPAEEQPAGAGASNGWLVLSRKVGEAFLIGDSVTLTVLRVNGRRVRLGVEAPQSIRVRRDELPRAA